MGIPALRISCSTDEGYKPRPGNPDPCNFEIIETHFVNGNLVVLAHYPGAYSYEGTKILLFQGVSEEEVKARRVLDPHFCDKSWSPFARFEPTAAGWTFAKALAKVLPQVKGNRDKIGRCMKCKQLLVLGSSPICGECAHTEG